MSVCYGLYRGVVSSTKDPLNKRRLRLTVPAVTGDSVTDWAWPMETSALKVEVPKVGQGVWVMYEHGDTSRPVWVGVYGKAITADKQLLATTTTSTQTGLAFKAFSDGREELDITATLVYLAEKVEELEGRVTSLEAAP